MSERQSFDIAEILARQNFDKMASEKVSKFLTQIKNCSVVEFMILAQRMIETRGVEVLGDLCTFLTGLESIDDSHYHENYHTFKNLTRNSLFADEGKFYKPVDYVYKKVRTLDGKEVEAKFEYRKPSISYMPLFTELYKLLGGSFDLESQDELQQQAAFYQKISHLFKGLQIIELGCGPGFSVKVLKKVVAGASRSNIIGVDKETFKQQPPGIKIINGDLLDPKFYKRLPFNNHVIFSLDLLEGEILTSKDEAIHIITMTHELLRNNGWQIHMVPYKRLSKKVTLLKKWVHRLSEQGELEMLQIDNLDTIMSRTLILDTNDINNLKSALCPKAVQHGVVNDHWLLALQK